IDAPALFDRLEPALTCSSSVADQGHTQGEALLDPPQTPGAEKENSHKDRSCLNNIPQHADMEASESIMVLPVPDRYPDLRHGEHDGGDQEDTGQPRALPPVARQDKSKGCDPEDELQTEYEDPEHGISNPHRIRMYSMWIGGDMLLHALPPGSERTR